MFGVQELATANEYGIGLVTIVFNNGSYGNVLRDQQLQFGGRTIGSRFRNPDFVKLAESFGVATQRVATPEALKPALAAALSADRPALIEVVVEQGAEASPWRFIHMRQRPSALS
jgi:acetolactate synthase-1/2/3 large subunit